MYVFFKFVLPSGIINHHHRPHTVNFKLGFRKAVLAPHCCYGSVVAVVQVIDVMNIHDVCRSVVDGS